MIEAITTTSNVSFLLVFLEGLLSFFSPCVLPLIPVYMGYLAGNGKIIAEDGTIRYERKKVFLQTVFFILGISGAFFVLGMSFTTLGKFLNNNRILFTRIGGILIIVLGLFQLGIFNFSFLQREKKIHLNLENKNVTPLTALIMGFTFSFAWTPCVGPALSSVLIMASGAKTSFTGNLLVLIYALGFVLPFLALGLFTTQVLSFLKSKQKLLKYTVKAGGILLILIGIMTFTGFMNGVSNYLNKFTASETTMPAVDEDFSEGTTASEDTENSDTDEGSENAGSSGNTESSAIPEEPAKTAAFDFTLYDQYGNEHTLSDYKGKVVFLNFWATWCPPCQKEMPYIEELYQEYNLNEDEVVILGVANPRSTEYPRNIDEDETYIIEFLESKEYSFPTVFDVTGDVYASYYVYSYPTTFMIDKEGNIFGYVPGAMTKDIMENIITRTLESTE